MYDLLIDRPGIPTIFLGCLLGAGALIGGFTFSKLVLLYVALVGYCLCRIGQRSVGLLRSEITGNPQSANDLIALALGLTTIVALSAAFYVAIGGSAAGRSLWQVLGQSRFWGLSIAAGIVDLWIDRTYRARIGD